MIQYKNRFCYENLSYGITITRLTDNAEVFMQGDDAENFLKEIERLDIFWNEVYSGKIKQPSAFSCYEEHVDYILSQYETIMNNN